MANTSSSIEWTDATWNPVTGCDRVSSGCDNCYALDLAARLKAMGNVRYQNDGNPKTSGPGFGVTMHADVVDAPLRWRKPRRIFVNSMSDLFHAKVPIDFIIRALAIMAMCPQHTFQILTKRPQRMEAVMGDPAMQAFVGDVIQDIAWQHRLPDVPNMDPAWPLPNVWLGVSVENQEAAYRIDWLVKTPAAVRFLSCEPLLGPVNLKDWLYRPSQSLDSQVNWDRTGDLGWVIVGGESGPHYRPVDLDWVRNLRDQCISGRVPFFYKQQGGRTPKAGGRLLDGFEWSQFPEIAAGQAVLA